MGRTHTGGHRDDLKSKAASPEYGPGAVRRRESKVPRIGIDQLSFGARLKKLRMQRGLTYTQLGALSGMSGQAIAKYEANPASEPGYYNGLALAAALNVSPWALAGQAGPAAAMPIAAAVERAPDPGQLWEPMSSAQALMVLRKEVAEIRQRQDVALAEVARLQATVKRLSKSRVAEGTRRR